MLICSIYCLLFLSVLTCTVLICTVMVYLDIANFLPQIFGSGTCIPFSPLSCAVLGQKSESVTLCLFVSLLTVEHEKLLNIHVSLDATFT